MPRSLALGAAALLPWASCEPPDAAQLRFCSAAISDFHFGLHTGVDELGRAFITKHDPRTNASVELEWARYAQCVRLVRRDDETRRKYLRQLPALSTVALGRHHPVVLAPAQPEESGYFLLPAMDFVVGSFVKFQGSYDRHEEAVLRMLARKGDCVVEVGANVGSYTVALADAVHDDEAPGGGPGMVYALEPFRRIYQILASNLALQGLGNVATRNVAAGARREFVRVGAPDLTGFTNLGAARVFYQQKEEVSRVPLQGFEEIEVDTLDGLDFIRCPRVDLLKIDAEGTEEAVIAGGIERISRDLPLIYVESQPFFQEGDRSFLEKMLAWGYRCAPILDLEVHELLLCVPLRGRERHQERLRGVPLG